jgi:hypothetical protein
MTHEQGERFPGVTAIHINLADQAIELEDRHGTIARVDFGGETMLLEGQAVRLDRLPDFIPAVPPAPVLIPEPAPAPGANVIAPPSAAEPVAAGPAEQVEQAAAVTLVGRLLSTPRHRRADRTSGGPSTWAEFAVAQEGQADPRVYVVTFDEQTAARALGLRRGAQLIVEGHVRPSQTAGRPDTFAVTTIVAGSGTSRRGSP